MAWLLAPTTHLLTISSTIQFSGVTDHQHGCCEFTLCELSTYLPMTAQAHSIVLGILLPRDHRRSGSAEVSTLVDSHSCLAT
jgi:hypothetical protein